MMQFQQRLILIMSAPFCNQLSTENPIWNSKRLCLKHVARRQQRRFQNIEINSCFIFSASFSRLVVSFRDEVFNPYTRVEKRTWTDTLSYIGGLCGLFMGASLLSIIELLYYLTLRIFFTFRKPQEINNPNRNEHVPPAALQNFKNHSLTLDRARPLKFARRIR